MTPEFVVILFVALTAWAIGVVVKAGMVVASNDKTYTFSMWDGGMIRAGKSLTRTGAVVKLVNASAIALGSVVLVMGLAPYKIASGFVIVFAIASIVCDFALAES